MPCAGIYGSVQHLCLCPTNKICVVLAAEAAGCVSILWPDVLSRHLDCSLFGSSACATNVIVDLVCRCHYYSCLQCFDTIGWASEGHPVCKKLSGEVICYLFRARCRLAYMPLPLTVFCFSKIQIGFALLVPAYLGSPGQRAIKQGCVCCHYYRLTEESPPKSSG